jgi:ATP/maltotriose-dependent transcriptional regulator MalT
VATTLNPLALLHAMRGEHDAARQLLDEANTILHELGGLNAGVSHLEASTHLLAGRPDLAEAALRADVDVLQAMSEGNALATTLAMLAHAVSAQGRVAESGGLCRPIDVRALEDDPATLAILHGVQAKVLAHDGRGDEAEALARRAVALLEHTDLLSHRGDAMLDLADVLTACGRGDDAVRATATAIELYERKGNAAAAALARNRGGS